MIAVQLVVAVHVPWPFLVRRLQHHDADVGELETELGDKRFHVLDALGAFSVKGGIAVRLDQILARVDVGQAADLGNDCFALAAVESFRSVLHCVSLGA